jgi:hypothetical protein
MISFAKRKPSYPSGKHWLKLRPILPIINLGRPSLGSSRKRETSAPAFVGDAAAHTDLWRSEGEA